MNQNRPARPGLTRRQENDAVDIKHIPTNELLQDKADSWADLGWCRLAEIHGIITYGDNQSVAERIAGNKRLIEIIDDELKRRNVSVEIEIVPVAFSVTA